MDTGWAISWTTLTQSAIGGAVGSGITLLLKDYFIPVSLETWRKGQRATEVFEKYKDPIVLSASDLAHRLNEIYWTLANNREVPFLQAKLHHESQTNIKTNCTQDSHFQIYKLTSTLYRFCSFLAWLELYRQDLTFLNSGNNEVNRKFDRALQNLRSALGDGHLNQAQDWIDWKDELIYREEARAIGEDLILSDRKTVIGYKAFVSLAKESLWVSRADEFFHQLGNRPMDFRVERLRMLLLGLIELIAVLSPGRLPDWLLASKNQLQESSNSCSMDSEVSAIEV